MIHISPTIAYSGVRNPATWVYKCRVSWSEVDSTGRVLSWTRHVMIKALRGSEKDGVAQELREALEGIYPWRSYQTLEIV